MEWKDLILKALKAQPILALSFKTAKDLQKMPINMKKW
jgi:hypothetical protein